MGRHRWGEELPCFSPDRSQLPSVWAPCEAFLPAELHPQMALQAAVVPTPLCCRGFAAVLISSNFTLDGIHFSLPCKFLRPSVRGREKLGGPAVTDVLSASQCPCYCVPAEEGRSSASFPSCFELCEMGEAEQVLLQPPSLSLRQ